RPQRIAWRRRKAEAVDGDVEVETVAAGAILHRIDDTHRGVDAQCAEILDERPMVRPKRVLVDQEFDGDALAVRQYALAVGDDAAGVVEKLRGLAQLGAILAGAVGHRRQIW